MSAILLLSWKRNSTISLPLPLHLHSHGVLLAFSRALDVSVFPELWTRPVGSPIQKGFCRLSWDKGLFSQHVIYRKSEKEVQMGLESLRGLSSTTEALDPNLTLASPPQTGWGWNDSTNPTHSSWYSCSQWAHVHCTWLHFLFRNWLEFTVVISALHIVFHILWSEFTPPPPAPWFLLQSVHTAVSINTLSVNDRILWEKELQ